MVARSPDPGRYGALIIDTHAHVSLDVYAKDRERVIDRAASAGVAFIEIGFDVESSIRSVDLAERIGGYCAVGIHPHEAKGKEPLEKMWRDIEALFSSPRVKAIGEIGLDYFRDLSPRNVQVEAFLRGLDLARAKCLPVVVHQREAEKDVLRILTHAGHHKPIIFHCFSGDKSYLGKCLDLGGYIGLGGPLTYPRNAFLRDLVKYIPMDRILVETDCPYLPPQGRRGKRNEPAFIVEVVDILAQILDLPSARVASVTRDNAMRAFSLEEMPLPRLS